MDTALSTTPVTHTPVLLQESITALAVSPQDIIVDGTFGGGGHTTAFSRLLETGRLICVDLDEEAYARYEKLFSNNPHTQFIHANFKDADDILSIAGIEVVNKVLLDLGTSTFQLLADDRGFSFHSNAPLSMTFSKEGSHTGFTAATIVNEWSEESIADILFYYADERAARKIAKAIVENRALKPILTAQELSSIIESVVPKRGKRHPATKSFQALRIAVNDELRTITEALTNWSRRMSRGGRIAVITFHSLEDRIVKQWMREHTSIGRVTTKKPIAPSREEQIANPRARSAKLRVFEIN